MDTLDALRRSENMRRIRSKNTGPEIRVRKLIHKMGYRYRVHVKHLPGRPDIVFASRKKIIFVHGCFWHQHNCREGRIPGTAIAYWKPKLQRTRERDRKHVRWLNKTGWKVLILWECEIEKETALAERIQKFLEQ